jgi:MarR family transcriptional regulator, organic hydroperoxide resistance regulator
MCGKPKLLGCTRFTSQTIKLASMPEETQRLGTLYRELQKYLFANVATVFTTQAQAHGLSMAETSAMSHIKDRGPLTVNEVAQVSRLAVPSASQMIDRLVRRNLLARTENPQNRRQKQIRLTPTGMAILEELDSVIASVYEKLFQQLPPLLLQRFEEVVTDILHHIDQRQGTLLPEPAPFVKHAEES